MNKIMKKSIKKLSKETCLVIAMEEIAELQQVISDMLCDSFHYNHLVEEMADVSLYIGYLMYIEHISSDDIKKEYKKIYKKKKKEYDSFGKKKKTLKTLLTVSTDLSILQHGISKCVRGKISKKELIRRIVLAEISMEVLSDLANVKKSDISKVNKKKVKRTVHRNKHGW